MNQDSKKIDETSHRAEILKDIINSFDELPVEFCIALSINPVRLKVHGNSFIKQREKTEIQELIVEDVPVWIEQIISLANQSKKELFYDADSNIPFDVLEGIVKPTEYVIVKPFFTAQDKKLLALIFIGYNHASAQEIIKSHLQRLNVNEHRLEDTWLLGKYKVIADIGRNINETLEGPQHIFDELYSKASSILDTSYYFLLAIQNPQTYTSDKYEYYKYSSSHDKKRFKAQQPFESSIKLTLEEKRVITVFNYKDEVIRNPKLSELTFIPDGNPNSQSMIFVPLLLREEILGVLSIQHEEPYAFSWEDVRVMELLGNQVSLALNSIRLYENLESINHASAQLISPLSIERGSKAKTKGFLSRIVETIKESSLADLVLLFPFSTPPSHEDLFSGFEIARVAGELKKRKRKDLKVRTPDDMVCLILQKFNEDPNYAGEFEENSERLYTKLNGIEGRKGSFEIDEDIKSCAAIPLNIADEFVGALFINFRQPQKFSDLQKLLIVTLAKFAALSIRIQRDFFSSKQKYLEAFEKIDSFIGKDFSRKEVMQKILDIAVEVSQADDSAIYLYDPATNELVSNAVGGPNRELLDKISIDVGEKEGLVTKAFLTGESQIDNNVRQNPDYKCVINETIAELDVPLIHPDTGEIIGVISLESSKPDKEFEEEDKKFLTSIASQAALAIKVAQAKEDSTKAAKKLSRQIETMKDRALNIIAQKKDAEKEIQKVLDTAREITGAELALLVFFEDEKPISHFKSITNDPSKPLEILKKVSPMIDGYGIIKYVAETKKKFHTNNTDKSPLYKGNKIIKSELAIPMMLNGKLYAVLDVESTSYGVFNKGLIKTLKEFAVIAVLVAQTANRTIQAEQDIEKEKKRFQILNQAMFNFGRIDYFALQPKKDLEEQLYEITIRSLIQYRDEGEMIIRRFNSNKTSFELVKLHNQYQKDVPESIPFYTKTGALNSINAQAADFAAKGKKHVYVSDLDNRPSKIVKPFSDSSIKCIIVVPITSGVTNYGNLVWSHTEKNFFDESDILLIRGLATQLGGALSQVENAARSNELEAFSRMLDPVALILHTLGNRLYPIRLNFENVVNTMPEKFQSDRSLRDYKTNIEKGINNLKEYITELKNKVLSSSEDVELINANDLLLTISKFVKKPKHIKFKKKFSTVSGQVRVDISEILEIIELLINNAIDVMPEGGIITMSAFQRLNYLVIEVADTGPGIPEQIRDFIFVPGYSTKGSTGLGLCLAKGKALRNFVEFYLDESAKGAKFVLRLPLTVS